MGAVGETVVEVEGLWESRNGYRVARGVEEVGV